MLISLLKYRWIVVAAGVFIAGWQVNGWRLASEIEALKADHASQAEAAAKLHASALAEMREREQDNVKRLQDAESKRIAEQKKQAAVADSLRRERDRLHGLVKDYAEAGGAAEDSVTACRDRASTLGKLLSESLRVQEELAGDAEREAGNARVLLEAWPK